MCDVPIQLYLPPPQRGLVANWLDEIRKTFENDDDEEDANHLIHIYTCVSNFVGSTSVCSKEQYLGMVNATKGSIHCTRQILSRRPLIASERKYLLDLSAFVPRTQPG